MLQSDTTIYQLSNLFNFSSASFFSTIFVTSWSQSLVYLQIHLNKSSKHEFGSFPGGQRSNFHQLLSLAKLNSPNRNCYHGIYDLDFTPLRFDFQFGKRTRWEKISLQIKYDQTDSCTTYYVDFQIRKWIIGSYFLWMKAAPCWS